MDTFLDFSPCSDLWFKDGNIILVCDSIGFRVNESILSLHSAVFKDMLLIGSSDGTDIYDTCPIIRLSDEALHMKHLLKMIYNRSYGQDKRIFSLEELRGLLHASSKYLIIHIRTEIINHLLMIFPKSIGDYRSMSRRMNLPVVFNPMVAVDISREFDIPIILPAALYASSRLSITEILDYPSSHAGSEAARDDVLLFRDALQRHLRRDIFTSAWFPPVNDCSSDFDGTSTCSGFSGHHTLALASWYLDPSVDIFISPTDIEYGDAADPCENCINERYKIDRDAYQPLLWGLLPVLCPRQSWHGWMSVKEAQTKAMQIWNEEP